MGSNVNAVDLEKLQTEYRNLLMQYNRQIADLRNIYSDNGNDYNNLTSIVGNKFKSGSDLGTYSGQTLEKCIDLCYKNRECTGATFYASGQKRCFLKKGEGTIESVSDNNYHAIAPKNMILLHNIKTINARLIKINEEINNYLTRNPTHTLINQNTVLDVSLNVVHGKLLDDQNRINDIIDDHEYLNSVYNDASIQNTQHYYVYIFLCILAIICIVLVLRLSFPSLNTMSLVDVIDKNVNENANNILLILVLIPICYILIKSLAKRIDPKIVRYMNI